ncbi:MAG TPA: lipocalin-like domain-containing protein [Steroidobacteraceae bacterium]|nr:lipocalin-like domain-containing protein [Steroidobacteraceae bacterium]
MRKPLILLLAWSLLPLMVAAQGAYAPVTAGHPLQFPEDLGSHPQFRTEWWYVTGWLRTERGEPLGFQITFFRTKPSIDADNPSSFTPRQIMVAHCALSDPRRGTLWQDQKIRRAALGLAGAAQGDTHVWIDRWSLQREAQTYLAKITAEDFSFDLALSETQAPLINGEDGVSRKGPKVQAASYYYSLPHMQVAGTVSRKGAATRVSGEAWFDHEWSSEYLDADAAGWDWVGINLQDGGALMAFQIRGLDGKPHWAGGTIRSGTGASQILKPEDVDFEAGRRWTSPRTGIAYPVEWTVRADGQEITLRPLFDDQENDTRLSTGAIYWEGAVRAFDRNGPVGRGYLELTGYGERLRLR